jgi:hypothetical protein
MARTKTGPCHKIKLRGKDSRNAGSPGVYPYLIHIRVHGHGVDRINAPSDWRERRFDLLLTHSTRTQGARLPLTKAEHVIAALRRNDGSQCSDISSAGVIVEHVEKPAVQNRVELFVEFRQSEGIPNQEPRRQTALAGLALRPIDSSGDGVDASGIQSKLGSHECMLTGSASNVQHASAQHPTLSQLDEGWLGSPYVPRRGPVVIHCTEAVY